MKKVSLHSGFYAWMLIFYFNGFGQQTNNPYHLNGSAWQENCNCYTLTDDAFTQSGSVWNIYKIDLTQSFDFRFEVNLGCRDDDGADGIAFVLQPISTSIGTSGEGIGFQGVTPSIGVVIDTWQNTNLNDPPYDHLAIHKNGDLNHSTANNLAGPVAALPNNTNIEDCNWHSFRITWDAIAKTLKASIDGHNNVETAIDLVNDVFNGDPLVFWGFTAATGGARNRQRFCTQLRANFGLTNNAITCYPTPILFLDYSSSFGSIVKWYWNFGDGTYDSSQSQPVHVFPSPGEYNVKLNILGNNGCLSDTFNLKVIAGSKPLAKFGATYPLFCEDIPVTFADSSYVLYGTINQWKWDINNGQEISINQTPDFIRSFNEGQQTVALTVSTKEGCVSDPYLKVLDIFPRPDINFEAEDACLDDPVTLKGLNLSPQKPIRQWYWNFGDGTSDSSSNVIHTYTAAGQYPVSLFAYGTNGCVSDTINDVVNIFETNAYAGNDTTVADNQPLQLNGSGGVLYNWSPPTGLSDPNIANPIALLTEDTKYVLTAYTPEGCSSTDTIFIKVFKGPAFYVPTAFTPNNDGLNDVFRFVAAGMKKITYFRVVNRWGKEMYSSVERGKGWDGKVNGIDQPTGTYVWMIQGIDYNDNVISKKGTVVLIR